MPAQIGYFDTLKNVAGKIFTFSKTITLTSPDDTSVITLPSGIKTIPPTTDTIKGDGTAGRVLRMMDLLIQDGTDANTIKVTARQIWNGDPVAVQDNIAKDSTVGNYALNANGYILSLLDSGITGTVLGVCYGGTRNTSNHALSGALIDGYISRSGTSIVSTFNGDITAFTSGYVLVSFLYVTSG